MLHVKPTSLLKINLNILHGCVQITNINVQSCSHYLTVETAKDNHETTRHCDKITAPSALDLSSKIIRINIIFRGTVLF